MSHCVAITHNDDDDGEVDEIESEPDGEQDVADLPVLVLVHLRLRLSVREKRLVGDDGRLQQQHRQVIGVLSPRLSVYFNHDKLLSETYPVYKDVTEKSI